MKPNRPYFLWDYNLNEDDVRRILAGGNDVERRWLIGRILTHAHFSDIWKYLKPSQIANQLVTLRLRPELKKIWSKTLKIWGYAI